MTDFSEDVRQEIRLWSLQQSPGAHRRTCPDCSHERSKLGSKLECLSVGVENDHACYTCWHCQKTGAVRLETSLPTEFKIAPKIFRQNSTKQPSKAVKQIGDCLDPLSKAFLKGRGISEQTGHTFGLVYATAYFPDLGRETHGIAMPYVVDGKTGYKVRSTEEKAHVCSVALGSLFGINLVDMQLPADLVICEGELDALSMAEAGVGNATSVPNGASSFLRSAEGDEKTTMAFLWSAKAQIDKAKRIILATDDDEPGQKLADELARRIGKHRVWKTEYLDGCKDANDVLMKHGADALKKCVENSTPWPVVGLYEAPNFYDAAVEVYEKGFGERILSGLPAADELYSIGKGLLTIVTGLPGAGKSFYVDYLMVALANRYDYSFGIASFENPPHIHLGKLAEMMLQKHFFETELPGERMSREEFDSAMPFITRHFKFLQQDDGKKATIESIIERIKTAVFRWGINGAVVDPWNYIHRPKTAESETQFVDDVLTQLRMLAAVHNIHIWLIAHPTKLIMDHEGNYPPPRGYSISGSASFYSKADFGLTLHKTPGRPGEVKFINWKTRYHWMGKEGEGILIYDAVRHTYLTNVLADMPPRYGDNTWQ